MRSLSLVIDRRREGQKGFDPLISEGRVYRALQFLVPSLQCSSAVGLRQPFFRKRRGVQKSMGNKVPCKTGMLIYSEAAGTTPFQMTPIFRKRATLTQTVVLKQANEAFVQESLHEHQEGG